MIIDTTYLLPLARIGVETDLLRAVVEGKVGREVSLQDLKVSLISIFELQAKAAKLGIPPRDVAEAVNVILRSFQVIPFYKAEVIEAVHKLRRVLTDYIDCVIVATAIALRENLVTEDQDILAHREELEEKYGIRIFNYQSLLQQTKRP